VKGANNIKFSPAKTSPGADFSYIFSAENSAEFLGKTIFQNFFRGKFNFFSTFLLCLFLREKNVYPLFLKNTDPLHTLKDLKGFTLYAPF
jgi:hypothetical protein